MEKYCCFCGEQKSSLSSIFLLKENVMNWLSKLVDFSEDLPKNVCFDCLCDITFVNSFVEKFKHASKHLKQIISESRITNSYGNITPKVEHLSDEYYYVVSAEFGDEMNAEWLEDEYSNNNFETKEVREFEDEQSFICIHCSTRFETKNLLFNHYTTSHTKSTKYSFQCKFCDFKCTGRTNCAHHMQKEHFNNNKNVYIKELEKIAINLNKNNETKAINSNNELCVITDEAIENINEIQSLLYVPEEFVCKICNVQFKQKFALSVHSKVHSKKHKQKKLILCPECGKTCASVAAYKYHLHKHEKKIFKCDLCPKEFTSNMLLASHVRVHTSGEHKKYQCEICNKRYETPSVLKVHLRFHRGEHKKYACEICEKKFVTPSVLKIHLRFHVNERPFKCDTCARAFSVKSHLDSHIKSHLGIKDKVCTYPGCIESYSRNSSLKKHYFLAHATEEEKHLICRFCNKSYGLHTLLKDHLRKAHLKIAKQENLL